MRLDVGLPTEIVTAGSDSNVSVCIRLGVEAIQRNCYNETNNNNNKPWFIVQWVCEVGGEGARLRVCTCV